MLKSPLFALLITMSLQAAAGTLPPAAEQALSDIADGARESNSDAVLVLRGDDVLLEHYGPQGARPLELMSVTKSVVALAIGALITDGKIASLDVPVHQFYPEWKQGKKQQITLRMLMDHSSGLQNKPRPAEEIYPAPDVVKLALAAELAFDPGSSSSYNNKATNLLAGIVRIASGQALDQYLRDRLFTPMGISAGDWFKDDAGNPHVMAGLPLNARDAAKIGRLLIDRGRSADKPLIQPEFIDQMLAASAKSQDLGLLWWRRPSSVSFHADEDSFKLLRDKGVAEEFVGKLAPMKGRRFDSDQALYAALAECLGENWNDLWYTTLIEPHGIGPWRPFHAQKGPADTFEANGSLGQYIVVIPKADLVAVRQIESRDNHTPDQDYGDFTKRVQALANALLDEKH